MKKAHVPVLLEEVLHFLDIRDGGLYLDCTFGAGGYTRAILESANSSVCAIDRDDNIMHHAKMLIDEFGDRFFLNFSDFGNLIQAVDYFPYQSFDGIVFDVGVSSMQIDSADRGFSFLKDGPLDMRMNQNQEIDAAFIVNNYAEEDLAKLIRDFGDEKKARVIAKSIVYERAVQPICSTLKLAHIIKSAVGYYNDSIHAATRTFQALRIAVNDELMQLQLGLEAAARIVKVGGVIVVVTFHSGEDEIVKRFFNSLIVKASKKNKYQIFSKRKKEDEGAKFELVVKKPVLPNLDEIKSNIRARSAKLRVIKRVRE